jgi:hypothetical protein
VESIDRAVVDLVGLDVHAFDQRRRARRARAGDQDPSDAVAHDEHAGGRGRALDRLEPGFTRVRDERRIFLEHQAGLHGNADSVLLRDLGDELLDVDVPIRPLVALRARVVEQQRAVDDVERAVAPAVRERARRLRTLEVALVDVPVDHDLVVDLDAARIALDDRPWLDLAVPAIVCLERERTDQALDRARHTDRLPSVEAPAGGDEEYVFRHRSAPRARRTRSPGAARNCAR